MVALWADAYAEAARADMPMRQVAEALESLRESALDEDALQALREADNQLGAAFGTPLEGTIWKLRAAMEEGLIAAIEAPDERRRRELFGLLLARSRLGLLRRVLDGWSVSAQPGDAARGELLRQVHLEAWTLVHDPMRDLAATLPEGPLRARLELIIGQIQVFHFGRFGAAREIFERVRSCSPEDLEIVGTIGQWWEQWGDVERARGLFNEEISRAPDRPSGYVRLGRSLALAGKLESAEAQLNQALAVAPGNTGAMYELIRLYSRREPGPAHRDDSIAKLEKKILLIAPDEEAGLRTGIADLHRQADHLELATSAYEFATDRFPDRADAWIGRGACATDRARAMDAQRLDRPRHLQAAETYFARALEVEPRSYWACEGLSVVAELEGDFARALGHARDGAGAHPDWAMITLVRQGQLHRAAKELPKAECVLGQALMLDPGNREALRELVRVGDDYLYESADREGAIRIYEAIREGWAGVPSAVAANRLGNLHFYERDFAGAAERYREAARAEPADPVLHGNLADALLQLTAGKDRGEQLAEAIAASRRAIALDPASPRYAALLRRAEAEHDLLARYGPEAPKWLPTHPPISISVEATLLPEILDESGAKLNEESAAAAEGLREAIWQRTGLALPAVTFHELAVKSGPGAWVMVTDGEESVSSGFCAGNGEAARREFFLALEEALLAHIPAWLSLDAVSASLRRAGLADLAEQPVRLLALREALCEAAQAGPPRADLLAELAGQELAGSDAEATRGPAGTDELPELAQAPDLRIGERLNAATYEEAAKAARQGLFDDTGVVLPRIKVSTDGAIPLCGWRLVAGSASDAREVERTGSPGFEGRELADALRPAVPSMLSRQLLDHYLAGIAAQRPVLVAAARTVLGNAGMGTALAERLRRGRSIRNLPVVLEELMKEALAGTTPT
jgi:tetratricopeptide (TPR) repeat protein